MLMLAGNERRQTIRSGLAVIFSDFFNVPTIFFQELIKKGANVSQCNKLEETAIDRTKVKYQNIFKGTFSA